MKVELIKNASGYEFPVYNGELLSWVISLTLADELEGFPRAKAVIRAMQQYRPEQLERERVEMLKGSFDPIFGHNARKALRLIESTLV